MKKNILKIFTVFIIMMICINVTTICNASILGDALSGGRDFINTGEDGNIEIDNTKLQNTSKAINRALVMITFVVVAVVGITLGIKYMMAGVDEKAEVKKSLVVFLVGCIVAFGAFGIWKVAVQFLRTL